MEENILVAVFKELRKQASFLEKPYEEYPIEYLADNYIKAKKNKDEYHKNIFISALLLRYWYKINKLAAENMNLKFDKYEFYMWVLEGIEYACKYHAWKKGGSKVNANQAINQCINTIRLQHYYQFNLDKNKSNLDANIMSLNDIAYNEDEHKTEFLDTMEDESESPELVKQKLSLDLLVQNCLSTNQIIEGIIIDCLSTNDCDKVVKKTSYIKDLETGKRKKVIKTTTEFWPFKAVKILNSLPKDYKEYFMNKYDVKESLLVMALEALHKANNHKKYLYLNRTLKNCREKLS